MTMAEQLRHEDWQLSMPEDCDFDRDPPPELETDKLVTAFASITSQLADALDDPAKRRLLLANRRSLLMSCETALAIENAIDGPVLSAAE